MSQKKIRHEQVDSGTNANQIVVLDNSGRLPAVDGSLITGVISSSELVADLSPQLGGNLDWNSKSLFLAGETWETSVAAGELCYFSGTNWDETDADAEATSNKMLGISIGTTDILTHGIWTTTGLTAGDIYYVSITEAGITNIKPSGTGDIVRVVGYALSTTELYFDPAKTFIEIN